MPGLAGVITDSSGILIIALTPIDILYKITISCAFWAFGTVFIAFFLLPIIFSYFPLQTTPEKEGFLDRMLHGIGYFICKKGKIPILVIALIVSIWGYVQQQKLPVGNVVPGSEILWPFHRYNVDSFRIIFNMPLLNPMYVVCEGDRPFTQNAPNRHTRHSEICALHVTDAEPAGDVCGKPQWPDTKLSPGSARF